MRNSDEIIDQLNELISDDEKPRRRTRFLLLAVLLTMTATLSMFIVLFQELGYNEILPSQPPIQSFSGLIERLENEPMTDKRFELLEANLDSIPSNLSLNQLKDCIDLFLPENYKLDVLRLLQPKVTDNYSDGELEGFKKLFNLHKQSEVEELLPKRKK